MRSTIGIGNESVILAGVLWTGEGIWHLTLATQILFGTIFKASDHGEIGMIALVALKLSSGYMGHCFYTFLKHVLRAHGTMAYTG